MKQHRNMHSLKHKFNLSEIRTSFEKTGYVDWHLVPTAQEPHHEEDHDLAVETAPPELKRPPLYVVVLMNDDYTPMDFVIEILQDFFNMTLDQATEVMLTVHYEGKAVAGVYPREIAETKANQVNNFARSQGHPLLCQIESKQ